MNKFQNAITFKLTIIFTCDFGYMLGSTYSANLRNLITIGQLVVKKLKFLSNRTEGNGTRKGEKDCKSKKEELRWVGKRRMMLGNKEKIDTPRNNINS